MHFDLLTIFPGLFETPFSHGVLSRALREGRLTVAIHDLREFTTDRHRTVDDRPFGGGEGMILKPEPIFRCLEALGVTPKPTRDTARETVLLLSAAGKRFDQASARQMAGLERIVLICGRYEGVDQRVAELMCDGELSLGDFVLTGGELPAACVVDAIARLLPGVLGHADSHVFESFGLAEDAIAPTDSSLPRATAASGGLLDYPQYTRPPVFHGISVPEPLLSGDHKAVRQWRRRAALERTHAQRPDLLTHVELTLNERGWLAETETAKTPATEPVQIPPAKSDLPS